MPDSAGGYVMLYTGTDSSVVQQTGIAFSQDLFAWTRSDSNPVFHPDTAWAEWVDTAWADCRDPFVFMDGGTYYLLNAARTLAGQGAISLASSSDLIHWTDLGPCYVHNRGPLSWHAIESPVYLLRNGFYHFFFSEDLTSGSSYMRANTFCSGWDISNRQFIDGGVAAEVIDDGGSLIFSRFAVSMHQGVKG